MTTQNAKSSKYTCIKKIRDQGNNITSCILKEYGTGQEIQVDKNTLKEKLLKLPGLIDNLQIDTQGRLVDKAVQQLHSQNIRPSQQQVKDMTNAELLNSIKELSNTEKVATGQLIKLVTEIYRRSIETENKFNHLMNTEIPYLKEQLQSLSMESQVDTSSDIQSQLNSINSYLEENKDRLDEIQNNIQNALSGLNSQNNISKTDSEELASRTNMLVPTNGKFSFPDDKVDNFYYRQAFCENTSNKLDIPNESIKNQLLEELRKVGESYYYTEDFYNKQFKEHSDLCKDLSIITEIANTIGKKALKAPVNIKHDILNSVKTMGLSSLDFILPGEWDGIKNKKKEIDYSKSSKLPSYKSKAMMSGREALWNSGLEVVNNHENWEIMIYVIQSLNKCYFGTFKIGSKDKGKGYNYVTNDKGQANYSRIPCKMSLIEKSLSEKVNELINYINIPDAENKRNKELYDRFIISYFACKKILYSRGKYPFMNEATADINALHVKLIEQALLLMHLNEGAVNLAMYHFIYYNNNRKQPEYKISDLKQVDLSLL